MRDPARITTPRFVLASLPWAPITEPSLGLSILSACLSRDGIESCILDLNQFLLARVSYQTYRRIADVYALNDYVFSGILDDDIDARQLSTLALIDAQLDRQFYLDGDSSGDLVSLASRIRAEVVPEFIERCCDAILAEEPTIVGFTCMYDQTIASLAVASVLRSRKPTLKIIFGGYAVSGEVGEQIIKSFSFVDAVCDGDGEPAISKLANWSVNPSLDLVNIPNLVFLSPGGDTNRTEKNKIKMDDSPLPLFDDFFRNIRMMHEEHEIEIFVSYLPVELSRGCWWGQKAHCTFCGIDEETLNYRQKSPMIAESILDQLHAKYGVKYFRVSDYILPHQYYSTLLPVLSLKQKHYKLSCEVKANLTSSHFNLFRSAGLIEIQPGIESFSTPVLKLMKKGTSSIRNIKTLVLSLIYELKIHYNILYGFPDERECWYQDLLSTIPLLYHLPPPETVGQVYTTRFSPLHVDADKVTYDNRYSGVFSENFLETSKFDLSKYCYYFETPYNIEPTLARLHQLIRVQCNHWKKLHEQRSPSLRWKESRSSIVEVFDSRYSEDAEITALDVKESEVFRALGIEDIHVDDVASHCALSLAEIRAILRRLQFHRLIYQEGHRVIRLPIAC